MNLRPSIVPVATERNSRAVERLHKSNTEFHLATKPTVSGCGSSRDERAARRGPRREGVLVANPSRWRLIENRAILLLDVIESASFRKLNASYRVVAGTVGDVLVVIGAAGATGRLLV